MKSVASSKLEFHALTHRGRVRPRNEDAFYANGDEGLFIVADGMVGASAGAVASEIVVEVLPLLIRQQVASGRSGKTMLGKQSLRDALCKLSNESRRRSEGQAGLHGMGAAVVVARISGARAWIAHLGDCRAYLCRGRSLEQVTKDHSIVQMLIDSGELTPEEAATHPARSQLRRFVGMAGEPLPDVRAVELQTGDKLLLCSDGLTRMVNDVELFQMLKLRRSPRTICGQLIVATNEAGGKDNVTALVVSIPEGERRSRVQ